MPGASWTCLAAGGPASHLPGCPRQAAAALPSAGSPAANTWTGSAGAGQRSELWFLLRRRLWPRVEEGQPGAHRPGTWALARAEEPCGGQPGGGGASRRRAREQATRHPADLGQLAEATQRPAGDSSRQNVFTRVQTSCLSPGRLQPPGGLRLRENMGQSPGVGCPHVPSLRNDSSQGKTLS